MPISHLSISASAAVPKISERPISGPTQDGDQAVSLIGFQRISQSSVGVDTRINEKCRTFDHALNRENNRLLVRSSSAPLIQFPIEIQDGDDHTAAAAGAPAAAAQANVALTKMDSPKLYRTLSGSNLAGKNLSSNQQRLPKMVKKPSLRSKVLRMFVKSKSDSAAARDGKAEAISTECEEWKMIYTNHIRVLKNENPHLRNTDIANLFIAEVPEKNRRMLREIGLDTVQNISLFLEFLTRRRTIETKVVSFDYEFDRQFPISSKTAEDVISSFRCANQTKPPKGVGESPFLTLNDREVPLPSSWDGKTKSFFSWIFRHCNRLFTHDYPAEVLAQEFCDEHDTSNLPYLIAIQSLTIGAFAPAATFVIGKSTGAIQIKPPNHEHVLYSYQIEFDPLTRLFSSTQVKSFVFSHVTQGVLGQVDVHWKVQGRIGEDRVKASLQFKNLEFNTKEDLSYWYQAVQLLDGIEDAGIDDPNAN